MAHLKGTDVVSWSESVDWGEPIWINFHFSQAHSYSVLFWVKVCKRDNWNKVLKNEPSKICGRQPLKNLKGPVFFKDCVPQILFGPFLNSVSIFSSNVPPTSQFFHVEMRKHYHLTLAFDIKTTIEICIV